MNCLCGTPMKVWNGCNRCGHPAIECRIAGSELLFTIHPSADGNALILW